MSGYVEQCEAAVERLLNLADTYPGDEAIRLRGKAQGVRLALSYMRDYPTPDAARLRSLATRFEQPLNREQSFTFTGACLAAMLRGDGHE